MKRNVFFALAITTCIALPLAFVLFIAEVWAPIGDDRLGNTGGILLGLSVITAAVAACMCIEDRPWERVGPRLSRSDRKALRQRESELALDRAIEQAERDAGLIKDEW